MKYLIIGSKGQLGKEFVRKLEKDDKDFTGFDFDELDISNLDCALSVFKRIKPSVVINCSAYNYVDLAEEKYCLAYRTNALGIRNIAYCCKKYKSFPVHYSSDYVFDGQKEKGLYTEEDMPNPLNEYGKSKFLGENFLKDEIENYLLLRLSWVFGEGQQNFIYKLFQWSENNEYLKIACDEVSVPTWTKTVVDITMKAVENSLTGTYHLTNSGYASRYEWARFILNRLKIKKIIYPVSMDIFNLPAKRPKFSAMSNGRMSERLNVQIPSWEEAVESYIMTSEFSKT